MNRKKRKISMLTMLFFVIGLVLYLVGIVLLFSSSLKNLPIMQNIFNDVNSSNEVMSNIKLVGGILFLIGFIIFLIAIILLYKNNNVQDNTRSLIIEGKADVITLIVMTYVMVFMVVVCLLYEQLIGALLFGITIVVQTVLNSILVKYYSVDMFDGLKYEPIEFDYNKFGTDKKLHKSAFHKASPYQLILHNQRYYLMALNEKWHNMGYYRLDRISNMRLNEAEALTDIRTVEGFEKGIDYKQFSSALPYMFTDKHEKIELKAQERIVDQIVDWFGKDIKFTELNENQIKVELVASPLAMENWAMQFVKYVEVVKPISLRESLKEIINSAQEKYK